MLAAVAICSAESIEQAADTSMTIASAGKPTATIVVSPKAHEVVQEATRYLQICIEKMSGAKLQIVGSPEGVAGNLILVGRTPEVETLIPDLDDHDLSHDGFVIKSLPGKLILTGKSDGYILKALGPLGGRTDCGTPNAVYYFLETLGCRWYAPGDDGEVVPARETIDVAAMDVARKPDVAGRWICHYAALRMGPDFDKVYTRWLARLRVGCNRYSIGHGMYSLLPRKQFAESHPEYFALVDGKRHTAEGAQFCLSNADVVDVVSKKVIEFMTSQGPYRSYALGQYDAWGWCECPQCKAMYGDKTFVYKTRKHARHVGRAPSDESALNTANAYLKFVNAVAERTAEVDPNCKLTYYALYNIPGFPEVKASDNVMPVMCHIAPNDEDWRREVEQWEAISKELYYYTYMGHQLDFLKLEIADDIRWCYQHKGTAIYLEHDAHSPANTVSQYLAAKAMWDTDVDSRKILEEFYRLYYGAAAKPMRQFYETFYAATREAVRDYDCFYSYPDTLTPALAAELGSYLTESAELARLPVVKRRIEHVGGYWRIVELHVLAQRAMAEWKQDKTSENYRTARKASVKTIECIDGASRDLWLGVRRNMIRRWLSDLGAEPARVIMELPITWRFKKDPANVGVEEKWFAEGPDSSWVPISTTKDWISQGHNYHGVAWYRTPFALPADLKTDQKLALSFGAVDGYADVFLDGVKIGEQKKPPDQMWDVRFSIPLPVDLAPGTRHQLVVRVQKDSFAAGIWKLVSVVRQVR